AAHVLGVQPANAADPETVGNGKLSGIDHVTPMLELVIEVLEDELGMPRHLECDNDRGLQAGREQRAEAQRPHALDQDPAVLGIAATPPRLAALCPKLLQ